MRKIYSLGILIISLLLSSCHSDLPDGKWKQKVKFDLALINTAGENGKLLGYAFCVPSEPVLVEQIRQVHSDLEVIDEPDRACDSTHFLCRFHPVKPTHMAHLKKIAQLSYIEEIKPIWR